MNPRTTAGVILAAIAFLVVASCVRVKADDLVWDDPNKPGSVVGFRVWREVDLGVWDEIETVAEQRWKIVLPAGVHRLAVSAIGAGHSDVSSALSEPATITVLVVPGNVRVQK